jgi:hypothetical protein
MFFNIDGGRSRISSSGTSQGARRRHFLTLMVGGPGSSAPAPLPRGVAVDLLQLSSSHFQTSGNASQGAIMSRMFFH